jgi:hypothetical protein
MSASGISAPRIDPISLPELGIGRADQLGPRVDVDRVGFTDVDLSGVDLTGGRLEECAITRCRLEDAKLSAVRLLDCRLEGLDTPVLKASRPTWRGVELTASRIGSAELYDGQWRSVRVADCRLGYLNFRQGTLEDVLFTGCQIEELDLAGATLRRVGFVDCVIETLTVKGARMSDVDLRGIDLRTVSDVAGLSGATVGAAQLLELAPLLATEFGILVE